MKTINDYLIEKLLITKNTPHQKLYQCSKDVDTVEVNFPECEHYSGTIKDSCWKKLELPESKYIIFNDKYRNNKLHFNTTYDFIGNLSFFQDDYENFNPSNDILYASNDLNDILEWYFNYLGIKEMPTEDNYYDWGDKYEKKFNANSLDNIYVMAKVYVGDDSFFDDAEIMDYSNDNINKIIDSYA